jgi:hypothetical protein
MRYRLFNNYSQTQTQLPPQQQHQPQPIQSPKKVLKSKGQFNYSSLGEGVTSIYPRPTTCVDLQNHLQMCNLCSKSLKNTDIMNILVGMIVGFLLLVGGGLMYLFIKFSATFFK